MVGNHHFMVFLFNSDLQSDQHWLKSNRVCTFIREVFIPSLQWIAWLVASILVRNSQFQPSSVIRSSEGRPTNVAPNRIISQGWPGKPTTKVWSETSDKFSRQRSEPTNFSPIQVWAWGGQPSLPESNSFLKTHPISLYSKFELNDYFPDNVRKRQTGAGRTHAHHSNVFSRIRPRGQQRINNLVRLNRLCGLHSIRPHFLTTSQSCIAVLRVT